MKTIEHRKKVEYRNLKTPEHGAESPDVQKEVLEAIKLADNTFEIQNNIVLMEKDRDFDAGLRIQINTNELVVLTHLKKLTAYIVAVTNKSPKKFRSTFVNRLINLGLDAIENIVKANSTKRSTLKSAEKRKDFQHNAYSNLKVLAYVALLAVDFQCITKKQYEQISIMVSDALNILTAWRKSESENIPFLSVNKDEKQ